MKNPGYNNLFSPTTLIVVKDLPLGFKDTETLMIRRFQQSDMDRVLQIRLAASIQSHNFVPQALWESKVCDMRDIYLPASETYVYDAGGVVQGFVSLCGDTLAAIFVSFDAQGSGIFKQLMAYAKTIRTRLNLTVYKQNRKSVTFYAKCGFHIEKQLDGQTGHSELVMTFNG